MWPIVNLQYSYIQAGYSVRKKVHVCDRLVLFVYVCEFQVFAQKAINCAHEGVCVYACMGVCEGVTNQ